MGSFALVETRELLTSKYGGLRGLVTAVTLSLAVTCLAGCSNERSTSDSADQPSNPASSQGSTSERPIGGNGTYQEGDHYLYGNETKVSDEDGEYEPVYRKKLENFTSAPQNLTPNEEMLLSAGFSTDDLIAGQLLTFNIALDVSFDSSVSDQTVSDSEYASWLQTMTEKYKFDADVIDGISTQHNDIVFTGYLDSTQGQLPKLIRDGYPRIAEGPSSQNLTIGSVRPVDVNGQTQMAVTLSTDLYYRISDKAAIDYTAGLMGVTAEEVLATAAKPSLQDGTGTNYLRVTGTYDVVFKKEGSDLVVTAIQNTHEFDASDYLTK